jgi:hypothetical protein
LGKYTTMITGARLVRVMMGSMLISLISACAPEEGSEGQPAAIQHSESADKAGADPGSEQPPVAHALPLQPDPAASGLEERPGPASPAITYNANDLLEDLKSLAWNEDTASEEQAAYLLQRLRAQGADALVPIRDFLLDGHDASPALREALLEVLLSLRLPQVEDLALELLASGVPPAELWQLGQYLENVQPGKHADFILRAAEQALINAEPVTFFPAEFFQLLGALGNEETALLLAELQMERGPYASIALAAIPDGRGLPVLEQNARIFAAGRDTLEGRLAIQLLAQQAPQFPQAAAALIELAEQGTIPHDIWPYVLDIVAGHWLLTMEPPSGGLVGSHTFYRPEGDQVIYRVAPPPGADDGLQSERLFLLDRLQPLAPMDPGTNPGG